MKRKRFDSVWDAIEPTATAAASMKARARMMMAIRETVEGEPYEIFPFLGSSRLEEPLLRYPVTVVLHGHAHHGQPEGRTRGHVPVYNVCLPLLLKVAPSSAPFRLVDLDHVPA